MTEAKSDARTERLKAALRENLKRRKAQARGREAAPPADGGSATRPAPEGTEPPSDDSRS